MKKIPKWKEYEIAVKTFLSALGDKNCKIVHNVICTDKHTNTSRQRDVLIETLVCNLFPIKILVSCKRYKKPLNISDIDHFNGEFISSAAQKGVIYSYSGFNDNALEKAKK